MQHYATRLRELLQGSRCAWDNPPANSRNSAARLTVQPQPHRGVHCKSTELLMARSPLPG
eukprot:2802562-Alexandrium_andersonii.AAC.1